jgi:hypothetical protein
MLDSPPTRTTLDIDKDVLAAAKELAAIEKKTAGKILSEPARGAGPRPSACFSTNRCRSCLSLTEAEIIRPLPALPKWTPPRRQTSVMRRATFQVEIVTPCFLGGADNASSAEWRAASIRGQLRWWFRALAGGELGGGPGKVKAAETEVFGSTSRRSPLRIRTTGNSAALAVVGGRFGAHRPMSHDELARAWGLEPGDASWASTLRRLTVKNQSGQPRPSDPFSYLGYGCLDHKGNLARPMIPAREKPAFEIVWREREWALADESSRKLFGRALWAWLNLGGIGARSRNGFGSLRCLDAGGHAMELLGECTALSPASLDPFRKAAASMCPPQPATARSSSATWTHFTPSSRIVVGTAPKTCWEDALALAGAWLIAFRRRYGADHDEREYGGRSIAGRDYAWGLHHPRRPNKEPRHFPDRAGFGLPLPFGKPAETVLWELEDRGGPPRDSRRASPLLLHVGHLGEHFYPVWTYLPSDLLPENGQLAFKKRSSPRGGVTEEERSIVSWFLDDLKSKGLVQEVTP